MLPTSSSNTPIVSSIRKFASLAGVSPATVSRVFSNPRSVAEETRQRILSLAEECGFRPNAVNRAPFGGKTNSVGVMLPDMRVSYFADIAAGLQQELLQSEVLPIALQSIIDDERRLRF